MSEPIVESLTAVAQAGDPQPEAIEAAKVVMVHDLAVAMSARLLVQDLLEQPYEYGRGGTDLASGQKVDVVSAVLRNGQLIHALTQDDTLLHAMTHVGATSLPLLFARGEIGGYSTADLLVGLVAAFSAAETLGEPIAASMAARGVRPTPVIGPVAAVVGVAAMERWDADRLRRAIARVGATAFGTAQAWLDGSQEWLFQVAAAGSVALAATRSSEQDWAIGAEPFAGAAGLFRCLGVVPATAPARDSGLAVTRASIKRFPVCAINQVPMALLAAHLEGRTDRDPVSVTTRMSVPEARYPGLDRVSGITSWSARLMSLPYCLAVLAHQGRFTVGDLQHAPAEVGEEDIARMRVQASDDYAIGSYTLEVTLGASAPTVLEGSVREIGQPCRAELDHAARPILGYDQIGRLLDALDRDQPGGVGDFLTLAASVPSAAMPA